MASPRYYNNDVTKGDSVEKCGFDFAHSIEAVPANRDNDGGASCRLSGGPIPNTPLCPRAPAANRANARSVTMSCTEEFKDEKRRRSRCEDAEMP